MSIIVAVVGVGVGVGVECVVVAVGSHRDRSSCILRARLADHVPAEAAVLLASECVELFDAASACLCGIEGLKGRSELEDRHSWWKVLDVEWE